MNKEVDLSQYNNDWLEINAGLFKQVTWYLINVTIFKSSLFPFSNLKKSLLVLFGAKIGQNFVIKPCVNIKYPWMLKIGDNVSIGEESWIDNLCEVSIGNNVCISQGAYLLTGNHNYKSIDFNLMIGKIVLEDGVWIGAKSIVCPGTICSTHSVLAVNSVAITNMKPYSIYQGNPAVFKKKRIIV